MADGPTPLEQAYRAYEQIEGQLSTVLDQLVTTNGFADLLATSATNVMALTRMLNGTVDRVVRSTRLAARTDVTDIARQLARTENKLERLLQAVEALQAELASSAATDVPAPGAPPEAPAAETPATEAPAAETPAAEASVAGEAEPTGAAEPKGASSAAKAGANGVPSANGRVSRARATAGRTRRTTGPAEPS